ncbi:MAG TPA: SMC-Scp complex subunit ScpB [Rhizomicrobium sp.]|nr:SMC-Scp complex subunit ScpB [Rhizomicrobium sp.]
MNRAVRLVEITEDMTQQDVEIEIDVEAKAGAETENTDALGKAVADAVAEAEAAAEGEAVTQAAADDVAEDLADDAHGPERAAEHLRMVEALLFASPEPLDEKALASTLPEGADLKGLLAELQGIYQGRGVTLVNVAGKWQFRTAPDLAFLLRREKPEQRRLSRAAIETLAIIAYHQPVTRAEIEDIRGVALSKGTLDALMEVGWIKFRGRRRTPGRPVTYGTTEAFLIHFGLENVNHLPGMDELKAAGFLEAMPPSGMDVPSPSDELAPDEDPYTGEEDGDALLPLQIDPE